MHAHVRPFRNVGVPVLLVSGCLSSLAPAAILQIDARINAEVQQFDAGDPSSFDSAFEEFRTTAVDLPIQVTAAILPALEDAASNAFGALAFSDFRDPTLSPEANPGEFGLEANVFSLDPFVSFEAQADSQERRLIIFSVEEVDAADGDTEREVESSVFVSGAVLLWTLDPTRDLSGMSVEFDVSVNLERSGVAPESVFSAFATIQGRAGGEIAFSASQGIDAEVGGEELLTQAVGPELAALLEQELAGLGRIHVVFIPEQELTYRYTAPIDQEFELVADIAASSANLPAGTGTGAVFGRSFEDLAQVVAEFIGNQSDGTLTQRAMNKALSDLQAQASDGTGGQSTGGLCGMVGMEVLVAPLAFAALRFRSRRGALAA